MQAILIFVFAIAASLQSSADVVNATPATPATPPAPVWLNIDCQSLTGDSYLFKTRVLGFDPNDNMGRPVQLELNGKNHGAEVFMSWLDPSTSRLYMEIVLTEYQTRTSDRVVTVTASWLGDGGDPVIATGVMTDAVLDHQTGFSKGRPEQKLSCQIEGYKFRQSRPGPF